MRRAALFLLLLLMVPAAAFSATRAGTTIESHSTIYYGGFIVSSEPLYTTVSQIYGLDLSLMSGEAGIPGGESGFFPVSLVNISNGTSVIHIMCEATPEGWASRLYVDDNRDNVHSTDESTPVPDSVILAEDAEYKFFIELQAPDQALMGTHGYGTVKCSTEVLDGPAYFGANGMLYGGEDTDEVTVDASIESLGNLRIWRDDERKKIYMTWGGGPADILYRTDFGLDFSSASAEALNAASPFTSEAVYPRDGSIRYYRVAIPGTDSYARYIVGKYDVPITEGLNQLSLPLIPYDNSVLSVMGSQVEGANNSYNADRIWIYNPLVQARYDIAWLVAGVGPPYDGQWYTGNNQTTLTIGTDEGFILQVRTGHSTADVTFVGKVSESDRYVPLKVGMNFVGTCFPVEVPLGDRASSGDSNLWESGARGANNSFDADRLWKYNPLVQARYDFAWLVDGVGEPYDGAWYTGNAPTTMKLVPGRGYWIQIRPSHPEFTWHYLRPY
jgi:hypothetical protein